MDSESQSAVRLLEALHDAMGCMGDVWNHYTSHGAAPRRPFLTLGSRPFKVHDSASDGDFRGSISLGLSVRGADKHDYDLVIDLQWDSQRWTITTEAWVDSEERNQDLLRRLPERTAADLSACLNQLRAAVTDLVAFDDLVPGKKPTA